MDAFGDLLRGVRANGALFDRLTLSPPWTLSVGEEAPLTLCTVLEGEAWLVPHEGTAQQIRPGDTAVVRGPAPCRLQDAHPERADAAAPEAGASTVLVGGYRVRGDLGQRLLDALPPALVVPADEDCDAVLRFIAAEAAADRPGQQTVLDRLLDWMLVCTVRAWFDRPEADPPGWYRALADTVVGAALRALHEAPARPWTVASLAAEAGVSRATLAKRFAALVGEPPLAYLTRWRMVLAADLLAEPDATVAAVARQVGYADGFSFSAAFKRIRGLSPTAHRATAIGSSSEGGDAAVRMAAGVR